MEKNREMCKGCRDDFYNGHNNICIDECWTYRDAQIVKAIEIGVNERPPYIDKPIIEILDCYYKKGSVFVKIPDQETDNNTFTLEHW